MKKNFLLPAEIWADILGYEGLYQASNLGRIRSLNRMVKHSDGHLKRMEGTIIQPCISNTGYQRVCLSKDGKKKKFGVHRLVWEAFNGKIPNGLVVNHINECKTDNRLENLNLMTPKENVNWGTGHERSAKAQSKHVVGYDYEGNAVVAFTSVKDAEKEGYDHSNIAKCCRGKRPTHKGLHWKYADGDC